MKAIPLDDFQKNVAAILGDIKQTHQPVMISDHGTFLVRILPFLPTEENDWLGCMAGTGEITGDIISPTEDLASWKVLVE